jgi:hypothetical protein
VPDDESRLVARLIELATPYGRYGYRRLTALLRGEGCECITNAGNGSGDVRD